MKIAMIALGCEKNNVNAEQMLWLMKEAGYEIVHDPSEADVTVVNTCAFIQTAKQEAIDNILELAEYNCKIIVTGCLSERYKQEVLDLLPEVSGIVGCGSFDDIVSAVELAVKGEIPKLLSPPENSDLTTPRAKTTDGYSAFIKLAEGCDNCCSYCVIPMIRGKYRSRKTEDILHEAHTLVAEGAKEIILIAQDTSRYGVDLYGEKRLTALLNELCKIEELRWIRLHYLYPDEIDQDLLDTVAKQDKIVKYLDIPIQHCNDRILKDMNRRVTHAWLEDMFENIRKTIPGVVIRTSLIVGFPSESEAEFTELCQFLRKHKPERAGVFTYSQEEGTVAAEMPNQIDEETKQTRQNIIQDIQCGIIDEYNAEQQGKIIDVLCEGFDRYAGCYFGRSCAESPEVDGNVFFNSNENISRGTMVSVKVTGAIDGDLFGERNNTLAQ